MLIVLNSGKKLIQHCSNLPFLYKNSTFRILGQILDLGLDFQTFRNQKSMTTITKLENQF